MAFSVNNIFYIDELNHKCLDKYQAINKKIYRNIDNFIDYINKNCLIKKFIFLYNLQLHLKFYNFHKLFYYYFYILLHILINYLYL